MEWKNHGVSASSKQQTNCDHYAVHLTNVLKNSLRKCTLEWMDLAKAKRPEPARTEKHLAGSRSSVSINFQQFVVQSTINTVNKNIAGEDLREELFNYQERKNTVDQAYQAHDDNISPVIVCSFKLELSKPMLN
jgi:hypothetical protein